MSSEDALFDGYEAPPVAPGLSADRRRTLRQEAALMRRVHPLQLAVGGSLYLHAEAAPAGDRDAAGRRCGNCYWREVLPYHKRAYGKCVVNDGARVTHGAGTDVRAWWPACTDHSYGDPALSVDAARCVPSAVSS